jgi:2-haloacid dehalogenase
MTETLAFDIYGTLFNTRGITGMLEKHAGSAAEAFSMLWREKVLEYSFRRALMRRYRDFGVCTAQALDYALAVFGLSLSSSQKEELLDAYRELPVFDDVITCLEQARNDGFRIYALSNGKTGDVEHLLDHAGIRQYFIDIISADEVRTFKPDPEVYRRFLLRASSECGKTWLVSSNPFDVLGAAATGMKSAWIRRSASRIMDPWEIQPDLTLESLDGITDAIGNYRTGQTS